MALSAIYKLDKVVLPSSVEFSHISSSRIDAGIQSMVERPAGHTAPTFVANMSQKPRIEFAVSELDVLLAAIGVGGASLGSTALYLKAGAVTGGVARATGSHKKITVASSCGYWTSIKLPHNGRGEATVVIRPTYDGSNAPYVYAGSQTLSGNLTTGTFFGAGPVSINGTAYGGVQDITVDSGLQLIEAGGESEVWDTFVGVQTIEPVVTIRFLTEINWSTVGFQGLALNGSTGLTFYARKYSADAVRVANATTEHIKFVGAYGMALPVDTNGQAAGPISDTIRVTLRANSDTGVPLTGTVSSAIT